MYNKKHPVENLQQFLAYYYNTVLAADYTLKHYQSALFKKSLKYTKTPMFFSSFFCLLTLAFRFCWNETAQSVTHHTTQKLPVGTLSVQN